MENILKGRKRIYLNKKSRIKDYLIIYNERTNQLKRDNLMKVTQEEKKKI